MKQDVWSGLDWETGVTQQLRPPWREDTVFSCFCEATLKFESLNYQQHLLGETIDSVEIKLETSNPQSSSATFS